MNEQEFGLRLRAERKKLGLTQAQLGAAGGVSPSSQNAYEAGTHFPDVRYLARVARAGVNIQYVVAGDRAKPAALSDEDALAFSEISRRVHIWASKRSKAIPPAGQAHLIKGFFEQYLTTCEVRLDSYEQTLELVG